MKIKSIGILVLLCLVIGAMFTGCTDDYNPAYDKDGFLGYSDGFWEWSSKQ